MLAAKATRLKTDVLIMLGKLLFSNADIEMMSIMST